MGVFVQQKYCSRLRLKIVNVGYNLLLAVNVGLSKFNWISRRFYLCKTSLIKTTARQGTNKSEKVIPELITQF